jgi:hypothetical protein
MLNLCVAIEALYLSRAHLLDGQCLMPVNVNIMLVLGIFKPFDLLVTHKAFLLRHPSRSDINKG